MMRKVWWQVVVIVVCAACAASASDVQGASSVDLAGRPEAGESASGPPAASPQSTAELLQELTPAERLNARLSLEGASSLGEVERQQALQVEALWAEGRHDEAIGLLSQLEANGAKLAAGIAWRQPVASAPKVGRDDVRIGGTRVGAQDVALDFDRVTGNLFAVVHWEDRWTVNISTDDGDTWAETFEWVQSFLVDAAVVDEFLYVAYSPVGTPDLVRARRFFTSDGAGDTVYNYQTLADVGPNTVLDISIGTNADSTNDRVYCYFIESDNSLRYFWDESADGTTWTDNSPSVSNAASNLDFHFSGGNYYTSWISYWGTDGTGHVLGRATQGGWSPPHTLLRVPSHSRVRISAHLNRILVSYQSDPYGTGQLSAAYDLTATEGNPWGHGSAYVPDPGEPACHGMDNTARGGWGMAVVFNREDGDFDNAYLVKREDAPVGGWDPPEAFNEFDAYSGGPSFIQYLEPQEAFGVVYLAGNSGATTIPYFDVIGALPFTAGFETGDTSGWSKEVP